MSVGGTTQDVATQSRFHTQISIITSVEPLRQHGLSDHSTDIIARAVSKRSIYELTNEERDKEIKLFDEGKYAIAFLNLMVASGMNLRHADTAILFGPW